MIRATCLILIPICLIVIWIFGAQSACADENFRVPRPSIPAPTTANTDASALASALASTPASEALLGDVIYAGMRTPVPRTSFERWRQNYCSPFICNMVLCHGTCGEFVEHCPSFSESGRVIHVDAPSCMTPSNGHVESVSQGSHCSVEH